MRRRVSRLLFYLQNLQPRIHMDLRKTMTDKDGSRSNVRGNSYRLMYTLTLRINIPLVITKHPYLVSQTPFESKGLFAKYFTPPSRVSSCNKTHFNCGIVLSGALCTFCRRLKREIIHQSKNVQTNLSYGEYNELLAIILFEKKNSALRAVTCPVFCIVLP